MRTVSDDRRTAAIIRDAALALFADKGMSGATIREIAASAGVSPGLVMHHFGSKAGLKQAVDDHVSRVFADLIAGLAPPGEDGTGSFAALLAERLERHPALLSYLRRLLVDGGGRADRLFSQLFEVTRVGISALQRAGLVRAANDEMARAAILLVNDLAVVLLRREVEHVLGVDPLAGPGLVRWSAESLDLYARGLFASPGPAPRPSGGRKRSGS